MAKVILKKNGYDVGEEIHKGKNSTILLVLDTDGEDYVVKVKKDPSGSKSRYMFQERAILEKLKGHEVIINLEKVFADGPMFFYCFKFCKYHSLESFLTSGFARHVREPTLKHLCKQLCVALRIVHENGIIHGEIHPEKILVHKKYRNDEKVLLFDIKLAGFSRSIFVKRVSDIPSVKKIVCAPMYYSPERMAEKYCQAGDMWAAGIIIFQLAWGYMPFKGDDINELAYNILNTEFDPRKDREEDGPWFSTKKHPIDDFGKQLIGNMLQHKTEDRYTAKECIVHTWLNSDRQPWIQLLKLLNEVKINLIKTKHLKLIFHIGCILIAYLPKRTIDIVKDFQHIYLNKRTNDGKIQTSAEFQKIIKKFEGKLSTQQTEKLFNTFNAYENGVGANEILSVMAINYMCKNDDMKTKFCYFLTDKVDANNLIAIAEINFIECDKKEITKEFAEVFPRKTVKIEQFTAELFGFHAADHGGLSIMTKSFDESFNLEFDFNNLGSEQQQSYLELSTQSINIDDNVACDDAIDVVLEGQEKKGKRTIFKEKGESSSSESGSNKSTCQKICACFF